MVHLPNQLPSHEYLKVRTTVRAARLVYVALNPGFPFQILTRFFKAVRQNLNGKPGFEPIVYVCS